MAVIGHRPLAKIADPIVYEDPDDYLPKFIKEERARSDRNSLSGRVSIGESGLVCQAKSVATYGGSGLFR